MTAAGALQVRADVAVQDDRICFTCSVTNEGPVRVYLLYRSFFSGEPDLHTLYLDEGSAQINVGLQPLDPQDLRAHTTVTWPSRSAGDPIEPAAALRFSATLPLPLRDPT